MRSEQPTSPVLSSKFSQGIKKTEESLVISIKPSTQAERDEIIRLVVTHPGLKKLDVRWALGNDQDIIALKTSLIAHRDTLKEFAFGSPDFRVNQLGADAIVGILNFYPLENVIFEGIDHRSHKPTFQRIIDAIAQVNTLRSLIFSFPEKGGESLDMFFGEKRPLKLESICFEREALSPSIHEITKFLTQYPKLHTFKSRFFFDERGALHDKLTEDQLKKILPLITNHRALSCIEIPVSTAHSKVFSDALNTNILDAIPFSGKRPGRFALPFSNIEKKLHENTVILPNYWQLAVLIAWQRANKNSAIFHSISPLSKIIFEMTRGEKYTPTYCYDTLLSSRFFKTLSNEPFGTSTSTVETQLLDQQFFPATK